MPDSRFALLRRQRMPSPQVMAERAQLTYPDRLGSGADPYQPEYLKANFDRIILDLLRLEYELYLEEEERVNRDLLASLVRERTPPGGPLAAGEIAELVQDLFPLLNEFFSSLAQARKARAGISFETHTRFLFRHLSYPFEEQRVINGKPDFLMPFASMYRTNPNDVILFTAKRTLRERWRQIIPEGVRTPHYFLGTVDERLTATMLAESRLHRVILVIPQPIIETTPLYQAEQNVIPFREFFMDYVDPAMQRWRRAGIV